MCIMEEDFEKDFLNLKDLEEEMANLVDKSMIDESLRLQLSELELLESMFSNPGEFSIEDMTTLADVHEYVEGKSNVIPNQIDFSLNIKINDDKYEIHVNLPSDYPNSQPEIYVRSEKMSRIDQRILNSELQDFVNTIECGQICIGIVIQWLQDKLSVQDKMKPSDMQECTNTTVDNVEYYERLWIYSHHIYNKVKRREILDLAHDFQLTGFCLPGKPGIICVEGALPDCEDWWLKIRTMNWKKIICKRQEKSAVSECSLEKFRKFTDFKEISFENNSMKSRDYHMDFGALYKYLSDHTCEYVFKDYFGLNGKLA